MFGHDFISHDLIMLVQLFNYGLKLFNPETYHRGIEVNYRKWRVFVDFHRIVLSARGRLAEVTHENI